jgi:hypothetical protein
VPHRHAGRGGGGGGAPGPRGGGAPDRGAALDRGTIAIVERLAAGRSYQLPALGVRNPGSERTTYRLGLSFVESRQAKQPPAGWFRFTPTELTLGPGEERSVAIRLTIPAGAEAGGYEALVGAKLLSGAEGAQIAVGAAARVSFAVASAGALQAWWDRLEPLLTEGPLAFGLSGLGLLGLVFWQLRRRFRVEITRRA